MSKFSSHGRVKNSGSRAKGDTYLTPPGLVAAGLRQMRDFLPAVGVKIADFGAGIGTWGLCAKALFGTSSQIDGYEISPEYMPLLAYTNWFVGDVLEQNIPEKYDLIMMNPAFRNMSDQIRKAMTCLKDGGSILCLAPLSFIMPKKERRDLVDGMSPMQCFRLDPRPSYHWLYTNRKTTDVEDAVLLHWHSTRGGNWVTYFYMMSLYWDYADDLNVTEILRKHPNMEVYKKIYEESRQKKLDK